MRIQKTHIPALASLAIICGLMLFMVKTFAQPLQENGPRSTVEALFQSLQTNDIQTLQAILAPHLHEQYIPNQPLASAFIIEAYQVAKPANSKTHYDLKEENLPNIDNTQRLPTSQHLTDSHSPPFDPAAYTETLVQTSFTDNELVMYKVYAIVEYASLRDSRKIYSTGDALAFHPHFHAYIQLQQITPGNWIINEIYI